MPKSKPPIERKITPEMTVLDIVSQYRSTEGVFKKYDGQAGICICCNALFDRLDDVAARFHLDLEKLMHDLEAAKDV